MNKKAAQILARLLATKKTHGTGKAVLTACFVAGKFNAAGRKDIFATCGYHFIRMRGMRCRIAR